ncbi:hypothetical protein FKB34_02415 [Glycocaulis profundi]|nr:hypothetical protein FKB34_02415 [Glycocaulis profundi]
MIVFALAAALAADALPAPDWNDYPPCEEVEAFDPGDDGELLIRTEVALDACRLPLGLSAAEVEAMLDGEDFAFEIEGDEIIVATRDEARARGALNASPPALEGAKDLHADRFRLARLNEGLLRFYILPAGGGGFMLDEMPSWRGPDAPALAEVENEGEIEGEVIEAELWSAALGETRRLTVYLPPDHETEESLPAVFFGDGGVVGYFARLVEPRILDGTLPRLVMVGAQSGQQGIVEDRSDIGSDLRNADYLPGGTNEANRFDAHQTFFADELVEHAIETWGVSADAAERGVYGRSSGGALSLQTGFRRPDRFGHAFSMSTGRGRVEQADPAPEDAARFYFAAGRYEPRFMANARISAAALESAGYAVRFEPLSAGHTGEIDEAMLIEFLSDAFGEN